MEDILFLTELRDFTNVDNTVYSVSAISAKVDNTKQVLIGSNNTISFELSFYTREGEDYKVKDTIFRELHKEYEVPNVGIVPVISGLFSKNKETVYNMAKIVAGYYGYTLKPIEEQIFLNK